MKKFIFLFVLAGLQVGVFAQDFSKLADIQLVKPGDYKSAEIQVGKCADYILGQALDANELNKLQCLQFIMRWMEGTPDYTFAIDSDFVNFCGKDVSLSGVYMAALSSAAVSEKFTDKSPEKLTANARELFLDYCANPANKVKQNKAVKTALKERNS